MKNIIVDTDILINFLRGKPKARDFLISLMENSSLYCSAITIAELFAGMREHERDKTTELINGLTIIDVTRDIAERAGIYRRDEKSLTLELDDCLIAASAFMHKCTLATGNGKHYPMEDIKTISVKM